MFLRYNVDPDKINACTIKLRLDVFVALMESVLPQMKYIKNIKDSSPCHEFWLPRLYPFVSHNVMLHTTKTDLSRPSTKQWLEFMLKNQTEKEPKTF